MIHLQNPLSCKSSYGLVSAFTLVDVDERELQKDHFSVKSDAENHRYVTIQLTESTKYNPGGHKQSNQDYSDVRMYENIDSPLDPVRAFEFYVSKLYPENTNLFAKSRKHYSKGEIWYTREVIGKNTLVNIIR